jgi:hypothetical protein
MRDLRPNHGGPMVPRPLRQAAGRIGGPASCIVVLDPLGCAGVHP